MQGVERSLSRALHCVGGKWGGGKSACKQKGKEVEIIRLNLPVILSNVGNILPLVSRRARPHPPLRLPGTLTSLPSPCLCLGPSLKLPRACRKLQLAGAGMRNPFPHEVNTQEAAAMPPPTHMALKKNQTRSHRVTRKTDGEKSQDVEGRRKGGV